MSRAIRIEGLSKSFREFSIDDLSLEIPQGYVTGLIGRNGAGKTTLIKCLTGASVTDSGTIGLPDGVTNVDIGVVFDECRFPPSFKVSFMEKVMEGICPKWDSKMFHTLLKEYGIHGEKRISELSRGMRMKLQVAIARSKGSKILILDEPTAGLDPAARDEFLDMIRSYMSDEDNTVLISSHITTDLEKVADYLVFLDDGRIIFQGEKDSILEDHGILRTGSGKVPEEDCILSVIKGDCGDSALISSKTSMREAYPDLVIDDATLDDIMVYMLRGERR